MDAKRLKLVLLGFIGATAVVLLVVLFIGLSLLSHKSKQLVNLKLQSSDLDTQLTSLAQAKKQVTEFAYFNDVAKTVIPNDKDQAQAVLDIFQTANASGIAIQSITFPASTLGSKASSATATGATPSVISQAKPVQGIKGLYSIELTITPQNAAQAPADRVVSYSKLMDFLNRIENNRRTAQISQVTIHPETNPNGQTQSINFTLVINIFIKPS